jgi:hypothetical protein
MARIIGAVLSDVEGGWFRSGAEAWAPTAEVVAAAEQAALECIRRSAPAIFERLEEYRCQYMGFVFDGQRRIYCNFFRHDEDEADEDWRTEPVCVLDGGDDYFHLEYDPDSRTCANFYVNGEA